MYTKHFPLIHNLLLDSRAPPKFPEIILPEELFVRAALSLRFELNRACALFKEASSGKDLKNFLMVIFMYLISLLHQNPYFLTSRISTAEITLVQVIAALWVLSIIGGWFNFLTLFYLGQFLAFKLLPYLYVYKFGNFNLLCVTLTKNLVLLILRILLLLPAVYLMMHTLPVLYEKHEDKVDTFAEKALVELNKQYAVFDEKVLQKLPKYAMNKNKKLH